MVLGEFKAGLENLTKQAKKLVAEYYKDKDMQHYYGEDTGVGKHQISIVVFAPSSEAEQSAWYTLTEDDSINFTDGVEK